jgi:phospholipase/carboxylesterase
MINRREAVAGMIGTMAVPALASAPPEPQTAAGSKYETALTGGASAEEKLPMVLALHFFSGNPAQMLGWVSKITLKARIIAPYGNVPVDDGYAWWPEAAEKAAGGPEAAIRKAAASLAAFIDALLARHPTIGKPIVTGLSHGGDVSYALALLHPDKVSAAAPIGARILPALAPAGAAASRKIDAFQGETDPIVPAAPNIRAIETLRAVGIPIRLHLAPATGHALPAALGADVRDTIEGRIRELRQC